MAEEKAQNKTSEQQPRNNEGQSDNRQNSAAEKTGANNDISEVDQEEGSMNNGESGGELTEEKSPH